MAWDATALAAPLAQVHRAQGHLAGRMAELGLALCLSGQRVLWVECCHGQQLAHRLNATTTGTLEAGQRVRPQLPGAH